MCCAANTALTFDSISSSCSRYSLLIEFNESDNIIWHSYLFEDSDNIYFECTTYDADDVKRYGFSMAKISEEFVEEIRDLCNE